MEDEKKNMDSLSQKIGEQEKRKLRSIHSKKKSPWTGLGMFGMVGWSVVTPTILGALLGSWLDKNHPQSYSWTLTCMLSGLILGCAMAWHWVSREHNDMHENE